MSGTIVIGVDSSTPSRAAIRWSMLRAGLTAMRVLVVHVIEADVADSAQDMGDRPGGNLAEAEAVYARSLDAGVQVDAETLTGDPLSVLATAAEHAELLVIGTHKTGFIYGKLFGSRFLALVEICSSAVAFIPEDSGAVRKGVVAEANDTAIGESVIRFAAAEAQRTSQSLTLVRASSRPEITPDNAFSHAIAIARSTERTVPVRRRRSGKPIAEALIDASTMALTLVVGRTRMGEWRRPALDSVVHDVLLNIVSPTIVINDSGQISDRLPLA